MARLEAAVGGEGGGDGSAAGLLSAIQFPPYAAAELLPVADDAFGMNAQCFVRQKATNSEHDSTESYCAFLFEVSFCIFCFLVVVFLFLQLQIIRGISSDEVRSSSPVEANSEMTYTSTIRPAHHGGSRPNR